VDVTTQNTGAIAMQVNDVALAFDDEVKNFAFASGPHLRSARGFSTQETRTINICEPTRHSVDVAVQGIGKFGKDCEDLKGLVFQIPPPGPNPPTPAPTHQPTAFPTPVPTRRPSPVPTTPPTPVPTRPPTASPSRSPTTSPSKSPTASPSKSPTPQPTPRPSPAPVEPIIIARAPAGRKPIPIPTVSEIVIV
jgi:hypothetical protein